ncbi:polyphosphate kinase 1 [Fontibacter flavus]|uniref:Polyphosphate kinase n=1 Tax=Fontibacter flavus TaxID=654838 RepID=A0ABV6FX17_9BACT
MDSQFINRDISWLSFNGRVLEEAAATSVPIKNRILFLAIFSSNLDEFYRVRIPILLSEYQNVASKKDQTLFHQVQHIISEQLEEFGQIIAQLREELEQIGVTWVYDHEIPKNVLLDVRQYFLAELIGLIQIIPLRSNSDTLLLENNGLYLYVNLQSLFGKKQSVILRIPALETKRLVNFYDGKRDYVIFIDDIIRANLDYLFPEKKIEKCFSFKLTRNAELSFPNIFMENIPEEMEKIISGRNLGDATRVLFEEGMPSEILKKIIQYFGLDEALTVQGGKYHHLSQLFTFPSLKGTTLDEYKKRLAVSVPIEHEAPILPQLKDKDILIHTPYHDYTPVIRFFAEASVHPEVTEIFMTIYRVAEKSKILNSLINAAHNGKKVTVMVELKARFDEKNNINWAKKMKSAGITLIYSSPAYKVHAKCAFIKFKGRGASKYLGLLATGNFNENTAEVYTDHILMTSDQSLLLDLKRVFKNFPINNVDFAKKAASVKFDELLIAPFNLKQRLIQLINYEINQANSGKKAEIILKMNGLEEQEMIMKLYEAANAGVQVKLLIRGICCLLPSKESGNQNIQVRRIVDRYLEHGRIFYFYHGESEKVYMGSADWMNRNLHKRVEIVFPINNQVLKRELLHLLQLQLQDTSQARILVNGSWIKLDQKDKFLNSQQEIYEFLQGQSDTIYNA